jgi:hypothetical protein
MRCSHRIAGWRPVTAISAAGFTAGMMLTGAIAEISASTPPAPAGITNSRPPAPGPEAIRSTLTSAGAPVSQPPAPPGPKTVVIADTGGDGPGPKAVVIPGGGPPPRQP